MVGGASVHLIQHPGHMDILPGLKLCRKGLHQYSSDKNQCPECKRISRRKWYELNLEKEKRNNERWRKANRKRVSEMQRKWSQKHPDQKSIINLRWQKQNPDKANLITAKRRAIKKQAIAQWANMKAIAEIYKKAAELTRDTGIPHAVDHIYPLQSKYMCGLHVETNLQILTKSANSIKSNRTWPGQLDCQKN